MLGIGSGIKESTWFDSRIGSELELQLGAGISAGFCSELGSGLGAGLVSKLGSEIISVLGSEL